MKTSQHTAEQIVKILEQAERGEQTVATICREHGIAENTFYHWRKAYGGMAVNEAQRLKELKKEHTRLKRLLAERMLEVDAVKELIAKKAEHRGTARRGALPGRQRLVGATGLPAGSDPASHFPLPGPPYHR